MKKILAFFLISVVIYSCKNSTAASADKNRVATHTDVDSSPPVSEIKDITGCYIGPFGDTRIIVLITEATPDSVKGTSIVGNNMQSFAGSLHRANGGNITLNAKEPGNQAHDGIFNFNLNSNVPDTLNGNWTPYKAQGKITAQSFSLIKKTFSYNATAGVYPQASKRLLKDNDLNNLMKTELEDMRNEIMARHGYIFEDALTRSKFESVDWYVPVVMKADAKNLITDVEKKNLVLIKKYEKYAADYGSEFGR